MLNPIKVQASDWHRSIGPRLRQAGLSAGVGTEITRTGMGQIVSIPHPREWQHPWYTRAFYEPGQKKWYATVNVGSVNGHVPVYSTTIMEADKMRDYGINPLNGRRSFSEWIWNDPGVTPTQRRVDIPLWARPAIALSFRRIGVDGPRENALPDYFRKRGVGEPVDLEAALTAGRGIPDTARGNRLLRACDIILHQPRQAITSHIDIAPGIVTGVSNVTQTLSLRSQPASDQLRVYSASKYNPFTPFTAGINPLAGDYEEPTWDDRLISTVYLLSPPNTPPGSEPDQSWTPHIKHELFWPLNYAQPRFRAVQTDAGLPYIPPLAGGAAQLVINYLTASINDAVQQMLNIATAHSMAGHFWTPTGGGSTAEFPVEDVDPTKGIGGLDKDARLAALRRAQQTALMAESLDPEFPYHVSAFPVELL